MFAITLTQSYYWMVLFFYSSTINIIKTSESYWKKKPAQDDVMKWSYQFINMHLESLNISHSVSCSGFRNCFQWTLNVSVLFIYSEQKHLGPPALNNRIFSGKHLPLTSSLVKLVFNRKNVPIDHFYMIYIDWCPA